MRYQIVVTTSAASHEGAAPHEFLVHDRIRGEAKARSLFTATVEEQFTRLNRTREPVHGYDFGPDRVVLVPRGADHAVMVELRLPGFPQDVPPVPRFGDPCVYIGNLGHACGKGPGSPVHGVDPDQHFYGFDPSGALPDPEYVADSHGTLHRVPRP